jgi:ABC-type glycerol-3-phosphate transport system substrate-binding protein
LTAAWKTPLDAKIKEAFWPDFQSALLGEEDPQKAINNAERKVNRVLQRGN